MVAHATQKPQPADLAQGLTSGSFESKGARVFGYWPMERAFVEQALGVR
jgi:hypothetical protein